LKKEKVKGRSHGKKKKNELQERKRPFSINPKPPSLTIKKKKKMELRIAKTYPSAMFADFYYFIMK